MSLLAKIRQDTAAAERDADDSRRRRLAAMDTEAAEPPTPPAVQHWPPWLPPEPWQDDPGDAALDEASGSSLPEPGPPLPTSPAASCSDCGCEFFREGIDRQVHCCQCVAIPMRRMATGEAWRVLWDASRRVAYWSTWTPQHWQPFEHLDAADRERQELEAAKEGGEF